MNLESLFDIENLAGQEIPPEIAEQLKVLGRVHFPLKDTTASAFSSSSEQPSADEVENESRIKDILDHVKNMEDLTEQLEDMLDQLTKNMNIPVDASNTALVNAIKSLGGDGSNIDKELFDKAQAIIDHAPIMIAMGLDPIGVILGNGKLDGPFMNCDEITRGVAKVWNEADPDSFTPDAPLKDAASEIAKTFEENKAKQVLEMLLMLWWNMMWPKFIIMLTIVNPIRTLIAYPLDTIITFFKSMKPQCNKLAFKFKPKECLKNYGPLNKALNKLACFLLCKIPPKLYKRYKPMIDPSEFKILKNGKLVPCNCATLEKCPPSKTKDPDKFDKDKGMTEMGKLMDSIDDNCVEESDYLDGVDTKQPEGLGLNPNCLDAARQVLDAVLSDALTPRDPSKAGISGSQSVSSILQYQNSQIGVN